MKTNKYRGKAARGYASVALVVMVLFLLISMSGLIYSVVNAGMKRTQSHVFADRAMMTAKSRVEKAKSYIMGAAAVLDTNNDGIINGLDDVAGNWVTVEDGPDGKLSIYGNIRQFNSHPSLQEHFVVRASGIYQGAYRAVEAKLGYLSFLKFARFVENSLNYGRGAVLTGMVYAGGSINVPTGSGGPHVIFKRDVIVRGDLNNKGSVITAGHEWANVTVEGTLDERSSRQYTVYVPAQFNFFRQAAQSPYGLYIDSTVAAKLDDGQSQLSGTSQNNLIDLSKFKNLGTENAFYDADGSGTYESIYDIDVPDDFNGIVWYDGTYRPHVKGELSGQSLSVFTDDYLYFDGSITTGTDTEGMPVNVGLVTEKRQYHSYKIPSIWESNAALFCANQNSGGTGYGVEDTDNSPYDNDNSHNWQGVGTEPKFYFKMYGPLITRYGGSNGAWVNYGNYNGYNTREWFYDVDITTFPPPFPIVEGSLVNLSWRETDERF